MHHETPRTGAALVPLVVDLDGTLTRADVSIEAMVRYARSGWRAFFALLAWMVRGRAAVKVMLARHAPVDVEKLPWNPHVLALIEEARAEGRPVILASASHRRNVGRVARHLGGFDAVLATGARTNLKGAAKRDALARLIDGPYDYVGDSSADHALWQVARTGYSVRAKHARATPLGDAPKPMWRVILKAIRPHQWAKNALVFVPVLSAHLLTNPEAIGRAVLAVLCMSAIASGVYLVNDTLDIDADRAHREKHRRPIASGALSIPHALGLALVLTLGAFAVSLAVLGWPTSVALASYLVLTTAYSFRLKAVMTADVIALACLYTVRIWVGALAVGVSLSFWLLLFSVFFFLSLAYLKRYTEISGATDPLKLLKGRGYVGSDREIVGQMGVAAGMVSILVLALFAQAMRETGSYRSPQLLWLLTLPLLYWINRVWMMARRGEVEGDPVAFALKDKRSIALAAIMGMILVAAQTVTVSL